MGCSSGLFTLNLPTASLSSTIWTNEIMFLDPAVHLTHGEGFRTTFWCWQSPEKLLQPTTPVPIPPCGLDLVGPVKAGWVRSLKYGLVRINAWLMVRLMRFLIKEEYLGWCRFSLFLGLALGWGSVILACCSGRYDMLGDLLLTVSIYGLSRATLPALWLTGLVAAKG